MDDSEQCEKEGLSKKFELLLISYEHLLNLLYFTIKIVFILTANEQKPSSHQCQHSSLSLYSCSQIKLQYLTNLSQLHKISIIKAITIARKKNLLCLDSYAPFQLTPSFCYSIQRKRSMFDNFCDENKYDTKINYPSISTQRSRLYVWNSLHPNFFLFLLTNRDEKKQAQNDSIWVIIISIHHFVTYFDILVVSCKDGCLWGRIVYKKNIFALVR